MKDINAQIDKIIMGIRDINKKLEEVEVKGNSVEYLFTARVLLSNQLVQELEKLRPDKLEEE